VHLDPHRPGRNPGRQRLLGALLPRARHPGTDPLLSLYDPSRLVVDLC
jgi:hypothetical protein